MRSLGALGLGQALSAASLLLFPSFPAGVSLRVGKHDLGLACPGLTEHPTGATDMIFSQNEDLIELFNSRWVPWSNS